MDFKPNLWKVTISIIWALVFISPISIILTIDGTCIEEECPSPFLIWAIFLSIFSVSYVTRSILDIKEFTYPYFRDVSAKKYWNYYWEYMFYSNLMAG